MMTLLKDVMWKLKFQSYLDLVYFIFKKLITHFLFLLGLISNYTRVYTSNI